MADEYGIQMYDNEGNVLDTNLDSALVVEGVLILGNDPIGRLALDILFPLREKFKGIFIMPVFHAFCINSGAECRPPRRGVCREAVFIWLRQLITGWRCTTGRG